MSRLPSTDCNVPPGGPTRALRWPDTRLARGPVPSAGLRLAAIIGLAVGLRTASAAGAMTSPLPGTALPVPRDAMVKQQSVKRRTGLEKFFGQLEEDGVSIVAILTVGAVTYGKLGQIEGQQVGFEKALTARMDASEKVMSERLENSEKRLSERIERSEKRLSERLDSIDKSVDSLTGRVDQLIDNVSTQSGILQGRDAERQLAKALATPPPTAGMAKRRRTPTSAKP